MLGYVIRNVHTMLINALLRIIYESVSAIVTANLLINLQTAIVQTVKAKPLSVKTNFHPISETVYIQLNLELRHRRRAFVNRASGLDRKASIANSCFASDFVDNILRASAPTFRWIRSPLFYVVLFRLRRLVHWNRSLPCFMPFEGILPHKF